MPETEEGSAMIDPYEEEQKARFEEPMKALLVVLRAVQRDFLAALGTRDPEQHQRLYEQGMNLLYNTLNLSHPIAHARRKNGRIAFTWIDYADRKAPPTFRWVVCLTDGTWKTGTEATQELCEAVAEAYLEGRKT
jgi:hypothetical protein